jgi:hypothetical protein
LHEQQNDGKKEKSNSAMDSIQASKASTSRQLSLQHGIATDTSGTVYDPPQPKEQQTTQPQPDPSCLHPF